MVLQKLRHNNRSLLLSLIYHDIFDYPLTSTDFARWLPGQKIQMKNPPIASFASEFYFLEGRELLVKKRMSRERESERKIKIVKKAALILQKIPTVTFVGVTGSLSMKNAKKGSDMDILIITKTGSLWTTRLLAYGLLKTFGISVRKAGDRRERDKLCLNMWMDESDLYFPKQNIFTAHELAQIIPVVNKNKTYEQLISINKWIFKFWPNAISQSRVGKNKKIARGLGILESLAYFLQYQYMKGKITREQVSATRALFHPFDWGEKVIEELKKRGIPSSIAKK